MSLKISLILTGWSKPWLLNRALETLVQQKGLDPSEWELIVTDDSSPIPIQGIVDFFFQLRLINIRYVPIAHTSGWRGIVAALQTGFRLARGEYLAQTNGHLLLPAHSVWNLYAAHIDQDFQEQLCGGAVVKTLPTWVSLRGFTLNTEATEKMDTVDWRNDIANLWKIPETQCDWTRLWLPDGPEGKKFYATHLCCSIKKSTFFQLSPWPEEGIGDYGTDDPMYASARHRAGIVDLNVWPVESMFAHMAHNNWQQDAMECIGGFLNKQGHTQATARIWDGGSFERFSLQDVINFWERGERTTDWRIRNTWYAQRFNSGNVPSPLLRLKAPEPGRYIEFAREMQAKGLTYVDELVGAGFPCLPEERA